MSDQYDEKYINFDDGKSPADSLHLQQTAAQQLNTKDATLTQSAVGSLQAMQAQVQQSFVGYADVESLEITQGGAAVISAAEATVTQGGSTVLMANNAFIKEGGVGIVVARKADLENSRPIILLAGEVEGNVEPVLDTQRTLLFGLVTGVAIGVVLLIGKLLRNR